MKSLYRLNGAGLFFWLCGVDMFTVHSFHVNVGLGFLIVLMTELSILLQAEF